MWIYILHTDDGRNPAPPEIYKNLVNSGIKHLLTGAGFLPSTVVLQIPREKVFT